MTIEKRHWVITGGAGALGQAMVERLLSQGDDCVVLDKDQRGLETLHDAMIEKGLPAPGLYPIDLLGATLSDYNTLSETLSAQFGLIDHLVHGASVAQAPRPILHQRPEEWMEALHVGVSAPLFLTQAIWPLMRPSHSSSIVFLVNPAPRSAPAHWGGYGAVQATRQWLVEALEQELGPRSPRVMAIEPDALYSPISAQVWPAKSKEDYGDTTETAQRIINQIKSDPIEEASSHD